MALCFAGNDFLLRTSGGQAGWEKVNGHCLMALRILTSSLKYLKYLIFFLFLLRAGSLRSWPPPQILMGFYLKFRLASWVFFSASAQIPQWNRLEMCNNGVTCSDSQTASSDSVGRRGGAFPSKDLEEIPTPKSSGRVNVGVGAGGLTEGTALLPVMVRSALCKV